MIYKEYLIRAAKNEDAEQIRKVVFTVLKEYGLEPDESGKDNDLNDVEQHYFAGNGYFGVAVDIDTDHISGTFGLFPLGREICELRKMYLLRPARGKGLGKYILEFAIQVAKEKNYRKITLETISPLKEAISLYKKHGFTETKPREINKRVDQAFELDLAHISKT